MSSVHRLKTPLTVDDLEKLKAGDKVLLSGIVYTARDAAHKRLVELLKRGKDLPFDIRGQVIYYVGPAPAPEVIESMVKNKAVYFAAIGGAAVVIAKAVKESEVIAYEDLGPEAIRRMEVEDLPVFVANDIYGNDIYKMGVERYKID